jgi:hypothetical protein
MSDGFSPADRALLSELESLLLRCDPVPDSVYDRAEAAFALVSIEDGWERLALLADPVPVRSEARTFRFAGNEITVEVRLSRLPWGVRLDGLVTPAADLEVRWPAGARPGRPDAAGFFRLDDLPTEPLRIVVGSRATPWFWT